MSIKMVSRIGPNVCFLDMREILSAKQFKITNGKVIDSRISK